MNSADANTFSVNGSADNAECSLGCGQNTQVLISNDESSRAVQNLEQEDHHERHIGNSWFRPFKQNNLPVMTKHVTARGIHILFFELILIVLFLLLLTFYREGKAEI